MRNELVSFKQYLDSAAVSASNDVALLDHAIRFNTQLKYALDSEFYTFARKFYYRSIIPYEPSDTHWFSTLRNLHFSQNSLIRLVEALFAVQKSKSKTLIDYANHARADFLQIIAAAHDAVTGILTHLGNHTARTRYWNLQEYTLLDNSTDDHIFYTATTTPGEYHAMHISPATNHTFETDTLFLHIDLKYTTHWARDLHTHIWPEEHV